MRDALAAVVADACFLTDPAAVLPVACFVATGLPAVPPAVFVVAAVLPPPLPAAVFVAAVLLAVLPAVEAFVAAACLPGVLLATLRPTVSGAPAVLRDAGLPSVAPPLVRSALARRDAPALRVVSLRLAPVREVLDLLALVLRVAIGALHRATRSPPVSTPRIDAK